MGKFVILSFRFIFVRCKLCSDCSYACMESLRLHDVRKQNGNGFEKLCRKIDLLNSINIIYYNVIITRLL